MKFSEGLKKVNGFIVHVLVKISLIAAARPRIVLFLVPVVSISFFFLGLCTNFYMETDEVALWTPSTSKSLQQSNWLSQEGGFTSDATQLRIIIHKNGDNVLEKQGIDYTFKAVNAVTSRKSFDKSFSIEGVVNFFEDNYDLFQTRVANDRDAIEAMSVAPFFPNGNVVNRKEIFGNLRQDVNGSLRSAKSFMIKIKYPISNETSIFDEDASEILLQVKKEWELHHSPYSLEFLSHSSYSNEFRESIRQDKSLLLFVFIVMTGFSALVFYRKDGVKSSSLCLGIGAVITVLLSILTSFGLLFTIGVPFTNLAFMLPFIILGIGLDDSFIIMGSHRRISSRVDPEDATEKVSIVIKDCGLSIFVTTFTTTLAFSLSLLSSIPAVKDFSVYASVCMVIDFIYQITLFIALVVINDKRLSRQRYDLLPCFVRASNERNGSEESEDERSINERIMCLYAKGLVKASKIQRLVIVIGFLALAVFCFTLSLQLEVSFDFTEMVPQKSFVRDYTMALEKYYRSEPYDCLVVFRDTDFADIGVQIQMEDFVDKLVNLPFISNDQPNSFWLYDFQDFIEENKLIAVDFNSQLGAFLEDDWYSKIYSSMIRISADGEMTSSSVMLSLDIPLSNTKKQIEFLSSQEKIAKAQPINKHSSQWKFFTFSPTYFMWDFFRASIYDLILNSILGLVAIFLSSLLFLQQLSSCLFITMTVALVYIDVLGIIKVVGMYINPVTYVSMILSIGLMVDYLFHIMLKYIESEASTREDKVYDCLSTIGSSIIVGGLSTILGTIPLAFSSSEIFHAVFTIFMAFVILSLVHGLLFLPLLLLMIGPTGFSQIDTEENEIQRSRKNTEETLTSSNS